MRTIIVAGIIVILILILTSIYLLFKERIKSIVKSEESDTKYVKDYNQYQMNIKEWFSNVIVAYIVLFCISYIFYRNIFISSIVALVAFWYPKLRVKQIIKRRKDKLIEEFKEGLYSLSSSLGAGKSIELAFEAAVDDLDSDLTPYIVNEFKLIVKGISMNDTVEQLLKSFAKRADCEDIYSFVDVFITCKRTEGDIVNIIKNTSTIIAEKIEIRKEIDTSITQKKLENKVLTIMPLGVLAILTVSSYDYMKPLYTTLQGRCVMTVAMIIVFMSFIISKHIMDIQV